MDPTQNQNHTSQPQPPPPPYTPSTTTATTTSTPINLTTSASTLLPPNLTPETTLTRGLQIPSKSAHPTSGFTYPPLLSSYNITPQDWTAFTSEILSTAHLTPQQWTTAIGKGLGVMAIGGLMIGFLGAIPGYYVSRRVQRNREERNMISQSERLGSVVDGWNERFFEPRGVLIRVDLPFEEVEEMGMMDVWGKGKGKGKGTERERQNAARKARIVIIPLPEKWG